jgi:hypothetical protein
MSNHPFSLSLSELKQIWQAQDQPNSQRVAQQTSNEQSENTFTNIPLGGQIKVVTMAQNGEIKLDEIPPGTATTLAIGEEGGSFVTEDNQIATTLAVGEEGGTFISDNNQVATTLAIGEEGGLFMLDQPPITNTPSEEEIGMNEGETGPTGPTTRMVGEEGGLIPGEGPIATTYMVGEEGGLTFEEQSAIPTTLMVGEEGGLMPEDYQPVAITAMIGEEGGVLPAGANPVPTLLTVNNSDNLSPVINPISYTDPTTQPPLFDENLYLQRYPEIQTAVNSGAIASGQEHFANWGKAESRSGGGFNEGIYRQLYPEVLTTNLTGLEHYMDYGKNENRVGVFTGYTGNDFITAFGNITIVSGVNLLAYDGVTGQVTTDIDFGVGQVDILNGGTGVDRFIVGVNPYYFYVGEGNNDYAQIQNFDVTQDQIQLPGSIENYRFDIVNNSTNISTAETGDLVAIIKDVPSLSNSNLVFG